MEARRLASQMRRSYEGQAWHGPALRELLDGVSAEQAAAKPIPGAHSIWELVLHIEAWVREPLLTLQGKTYVLHAGEDDWPPVRETTPEAWQAAQAQLESTARQLVEAVRATDDAKLNELVGGREYTFYFLLHGVVQHNLYHAGQIALLKKAAARDLRA